MSEELALDLQGVSKLYRGQREEGRGIFGWGRGGRRDSGAFASVEDDDDLPDDLEEVEDEEESRPVAQEDVWALRDVSFQVPIGSRVGVLGGPGSGKSTLTGLLTGVALPTDGRILVRGRVSPLLKTASGLMWPYDDVRRNITHIARFLRGPVHLARERADEIAEFADLADKLDDEAMELDSLELQRLGIAIALLLDPDVLVADDTIGFGDISFQSRVYEHLQGKAAQTTLVFATQDLESVRQLCDRAVVLDGGRVVDSGPMIDVAARYEKALISQAEARATATGFGSGPSEHPAGPGPLRSARPFGPDGEPAQRLDPGDPAMIEVRVAAGEGEELLLRCSMTLKGSRHVIRITQPTATEVRGPGTYALAVHLPAGMLFEDTYEAEVLVSNWSEGYGTLVGKLPMAFRLGVSGEATAVAHPGVVTQGPKRHIGLPWESVKVEAGEGG